MEILIFSLIGGGLIIVGLWLATRESKPDK